MNQDEVKALEEKILAQHQALEKSLRLTQIVYIILAIVVLIYTSVVVSKLKDATSPDMVAELASSMVQEHLPEQRARLIETIHDNKDEWAQVAVEQVHAQMPELEGKIEVLVDQMALRLAEDVEKKLMPKFIEFIKSDSAKLNETFKNATDAEIAAGFVELFIDVIERELDTFLNDKFIDAVNNLQKEMHHLSKPGAELTKREDAQRRLIQNWAHLADHQEFGTALFTDVLSAVRRKFTDMTAEDGEGVLIEPVDGVDAPLRLIKE